MTHRRGAAEIEFIMVLPILMIMFMGLVWAGRVSIARATSNVAVRHDAWVARRDMNHDPFNFRNTTAGVAHASADATVQISTPRLASSSTFTASVHGDSWGSRSVKLNKPPHWPLMAKVLRAGGQNGIDDVNSVVNSLGAAGRSIVSVSASLPSLDRLVSSFRQNITDAQANVNERRRQAAAAAAEKVIAEARTKVAQLDKNIPLLEQDLKKASELPSPAREVAVEAAQKALENAKLLRAAYENVIQTSAGDSRPGQ